MASFALITEGITDQVVIDAVVYTHYDEIDDIEINVLQPLRDATDASRQAAHGGWENVFEFCATALTDDVFQFNDFVIVNVDTDCGDHKNFGLDFKANGEEKSVDRLVLDTREILSAKIPAPVLEQYRDRIIFAIAVHSVECWLIPLYTPATDKPKISGCVTRLARALAKRNIAHAKTYPCYLDLCRPLNKPKGLLHCVSRDRSLQMFVESLPTMQPG